MQIANRSLLHEFALAHSDAKKSLVAWEDHTKNVVWTTPHQLKNSYPKASVIGKKNVVFDIKNNDYRLWVKINYAASVVFIEKVGTHKEYDTWNII